MKNKPGKEKGKIRVIDTGSLSAAENMALDETLLELRDENKIPDTVRFLSFEPHSVLSGHFQTIENEIRTGYCAQHGIEINRRITGGGALYWGTKDIGWEIFANRERFCAQISKVEDYYRLFCNAFARGLGGFGLDASFRPRNDIEIEGRKISGTGGTSIKSAFMFQGTLLVDINIDIMLRALRIPLEKLKYKEVKSLKERITWLSRELGYCPSRESIIKNILRGFSESFSTDFYFDALTAQEKKLFKKKIDYFKSEKHIYKIKQPGTSFAVSSIVKTPTGFLKCNASVDFKRSILKSIIFTGDFFIYPRRTIFDIEAVLKNINFNKHSTGKVIKNFYKNYSQKIEGIKSGTVIDTVNGCIDKLKLKHYGIPDKNLKDIFLVYPKNLNSNKTEEEDILKKIEIFLLPYCAKLPKCKFRRRQGCTFCGKCSTGEVVGFLEGQGVKSISIVSYEHLNSTLRKLKREGIKYFGGACCEAFYIKHVQDFQRIGLPGILVNIDNTTCYDLGKYDEAYAGKFEGFTSLKVSLIKKIIKADS